MEQESTGEESSYEGSGSEEGETDESGSGSETGSTSEDESDDEEPVLKYKRFAKDVVNAIHDGKDSGEKNIICCIAVHPKVPHRYSLSPFFCILLHVDCR